MDSLTTEIRGTSKIRTSAQMLIYFEDIHHFAIVCSFALLKSDFKTKFNFSAIKYPNFSDAVFHRVTMRGDQSVQSVYRHELMLWYGTKQCFVIRYQTILCDMVSNSIVWYGIKNIYKKIKFSFFVFKSEQFTQHSLSAKMIEHRFRKYFLKNDDDALLRMWFSPFLQKYDLFFFMKTHHLLSDFWNVIELTQNMIPI